MTTSTILSSVMTVVSFVTFIGIVVWAYSRKRKRAFDEAANAPFALPDDAESVPARNAREGRPS
ncbi:MAG: cbb3-type cytochrome c oxidase subunit 3 [Burkholderiales bacterium]